MKYALLLLLLLLLVRCKEDAPGEDAAAQAGEEAGCIFDMESQDDSFLKDKPQFQGYTWNDETKQAVIPLPHQDTLIVHRGGCRTYSFSAMLRTRGDSLPPFRDTSYWLGKARWLASSFFDAEDASFADSALATIKKGIPSDGITTEYQIPHPEYSAFYVRMDSLPPLRMLTIGYVQPGEE